MPEEPTTTSTDGRRGLRRSMLTLTPTPTTTTTGPAPTPHTTCHGPPTRIHYTGAHGGTLCAAAMQHRRPLFLSPARLLVRGPTREQPTPGRGQPNRSCEAYRCRLETLAHCIPPRRPCPVVGHARCCLLPAAASCASVGASPPTLCKPACQPRPRASLPRRFRHKPARCHWTLVANPGRHFQRPSFFCCVSPAPPFAHARTPADASAFPSSPSTLLMAPSRSSLHFLCQRRAIRAGVSPRHTFLLPSRLVALVAAHLTLSGWECYSTVWAAPLPGRRRGKLVDSRDFRPLQL